MRRRFKAGTALGLALGIFSLAFLGIRDDSNSRYTYQPIRTKPKKTQDAEFNESPLIVSDSGKDSPVSLEKTVDTRVDPPPVAGEGNLFEDLIYGWWEDYSEVLDLSKQRDGVVRIDDNVPKNFGSLSVKVHGENVYAGREFNAGLKYVRTRLALGYLAERFLEDAVNENRGQFEEFENREFAEEHMEALSGEYRLKQIEGEGCYAIVNMSELHDSELYKKMSSDLEGLLERLRYYDAKENVEIAINISHMPIAPYGPWGFRR